MGVKDIHAHSFLRLEDPTLSILYLKTHKQGILNSEYNRMWQNQQIL